MLGDLLGAVGDGIRNAACKQKERRDRKVLMSLLHQVVNLRLQTWSSRPKGYLRVETSDQLLDGTVARRPPTAMGQQYALVGLGFSEPMGYVLLELRTTAQIGQALHR